MRFVICTAVTLVVACNSLVGNDPPKLRTAVVAQQDAGGGADAAPPAIQCAGDEKVCFETCVPKFSSGFSCATEGACEPCPQYAHATPICNGPACSAECKKGYENCDTSAPDCETDLASATTCGACNVKCEKFCSPDAAGSFKCTESCDPGLAPCGSQCVDLQGSVTSCGACDKKCPEPDHSAATCKAAQCGFDCDPGFHACGGQCVPVTSADACGDACTPCGSPPPNSRVVCNRGACETSCQFGWGDCDGEKSNGCEVDLMNDSSNCGGCKNVCSGFATTLSLEPLTTNPFPGPGPTNGCCLQGKCLDCNAF